MNLVEAIVLIVVISCLVCVLFKDKIKKEPELHLDISSDYNQKIPVRIKIVDLQRKRDTYNPYFEIVFLAEGKQYATRTGCDSFTANYKRPPDYAMVSSTGSVIFKYLECFDIVTSIKRKIIRLVPGLLETDIEIVFDQSPVADTLKVVQQSK